MKFLFEGYGGLLIVALFGAGLMKLFSWILDVVLRLCASGVY